MKKFKLLLEIFIVFFKLGIISFGGGYAMIPLIEREVVERKKWIEKDNVAEIFTISGTLPGAVALNASAFTGYSIAGIRGAAAALLGNLTPSVIIVLLLSAFVAAFKDNLYLEAVLKGIYPAVVAFVIYAAWKIAKSALKDIFTIALMVLAFVGAAVVHVQLIPLILSGLAVGLLFGVIKEKLDGRKPQRNNGGEEEST